MRNRKEIAERYDKVMAQWKMASEDYEKTPFDSRMKVELSFRLTEIETELYVLRWVLEMK